MRARLSELPDGTFTGSRLVEDLGHGLGDLEIGVTATIDWRHDAGRAVRAAADPLLHELVPSEHDERRLPGADHVPPARAAVQRGHVPARSRSTTAPTGRS